ncbi:SixA phosphatase family protein [Paucihalobacter sp.]|uniref:SixA phosphatase family protein n=1 Tax=Paucihalobacter sp. TaxID=2850405 RepID=UPI002FDFBF5D
MKNLVVVRHGKSSWNHNVGDVLRPLTDRGKNDIKFIGDCFNSFNLNPDCIFTSPAKRAHDTAMIFNSRLKEMQNSIIIVDELYDFEGRQVVNFIKSLSNDYNFIIIFGHNNALTSISNIFGSKAIDNLPTAGLVHICFNVNNWNEIRKGTTKLTLFPKQLRND